MMARVLMLLLIPAALVQVSCTRNKSAAISPPPLDVPIEINTWQRSTTPVPGTVGELDLTIDDITRGQVMTSLARHGETLRGPISLREGASIDFTLDGHAYALHLTALDNALVGEDAATFVIRAARSDVVIEQAKIEHLIQSVASLEDAVFIRNGREHTVEESVEHLRRKWQAAADEVHTAAQFIEGVASRSSMSGEPYEIRFADGTVTTSRKYLEQQLDRVESSDME